MDNRIKEQQLGLLADRTSCKRFLANQFRFFIKCVGIRFGGAVATDWPGSHGDGEGPGGNDSIEASEGGVESNLFGSPRGFSDVERLCLPGII
jgi:hypothetical protein